LEGTKNADELFTDGISSWRVQNCGQVIVHTDFLSAVAGAQFSMNFVNISSVIVQQSAFALHGEKNFYIFY